MKAVYYEEFGGPEVLKVGERPMPQIVADEVLVQVASASVNPIDRRLRGRHTRQNYFIAHWPIIPGWDFSGKIAQVGPLVKGWQEGDDVVGLAFNWHLHHGTYAEFVPVKATNIAHKPETLSFIEAAALPLVSLTAWQAFTEHGMLEAGQSVFIQAGAGGLGSVAIPMAKHLGAKVYTTCSTQNIKYVRSRGADHIIDYSKENYLNVIRNKEPDGVDFVFESLNGMEAVEGAIHIVKNNGTVIYLSHAPPELDEITERNIYAELIHHHPDGKMLEELLLLYADGTLHIPNIETMPVEQAPEAHRLLETWHVQGKVVLNVVDL